MLNCGTDSKGNEWYQYGSLLLCFGGGHHYNVIRFKNSTEASLQFIYSVRM